jgi:superfamily I DNA and/or RNA helicase
MVQFFEDRCRIVYRNGYHELARSSEIRIVESALNDPSSQNCFDYFKKTASKIGLIVGDHNILASRYEKIGYIREDSIVANYLRKEYPDSNDTPVESAIFPFGFNLSQKNAVENALQNRLSVIEGPPGTGKTQTILNIIANAVMLGESVAVVSSNNSATANVYEKLQKYGVEFIAAPLGSNENKTAFLENQITDLPDMRW